MNNQLNQQFFDLYTFLNVAKKYSDTISAFENDSKMCEQHFFSIKNKRISAFVPNILCIFFGIGIFLMGLLVCVSSLANADKTLQTVDLYISNSSAFFTGIIICAFSLVLIIIIPIVVNTSCKKKRVQQAKQADEFWTTVGSPTMVENNRAIEQLRKEYSVFTDKYMYTLDFLPSQYHRMDTIAHMYSIVSSGRADTLKEVISIYEEEMRWQELRNQLSYQQEIINENMEKLYNQQVKTNKILNEIEFFQICHYLEEK